MAKLVFKNVNIKEVDNLRKNVKTIKTLSVILGLSLLLNLGLLWINIQN